MDSSLKTDGDLALLIADQCVYFSSLERKPHEPSSAILQLIQGIYEIYPDQARRMLRNRIYATGEITALCHGAIKVSAKRFHEGLAPLLESGAAKDLKWIPISKLKKSDPGPLPHPLTLWKKASPPSSNSDFLWLAKELSTLVPRTGPLYQQARAVGALLTSAQGEILHWGVNTNSSNRTLHAELNLIQDYFEQTGRSIPEGAKLYVTLKPCKMCAGALWIAAKNPFTLQVYFSEFDSGRNAKWTILDVNSAERKNAAHNATELLTQLQYQV